MTTPRELHNKAMEFTDLALVARVKGDVNQVSSYFRQALSHELQAAEYYKDRIDLEPTRSVLYRSAASLALDCKDWRLAEQLISTGLVGDPPEEIAEELRDLQQQVHFLRSLYHQGYELKNRDFSISLFGHQTGVGIALADVVIDRLQNIRSLTHRTIERKLNQPYRESGASKFSSNYPMFLKAFSRGSFNIILTIGEPLQLQLPNFEDTDPIPQIIQEIMDCIELVNRREEELLRARIPDVAYYNNFVSLVNKLAPDGDTVEYVYFASTSGNETRRVPLQRRQDDIARIPKITSSSGREYQQGELETINGTLLFADAIREIHSGQIKLLDENNKKMTIDVPKGMDDIVGPLWSQQVIATVRKIGKKRYLENIERLNG